MLKAERKGSVAVPQWVVASKQTGTKFLVCLLAPRAISFMHASFQTKNDPITLWMHAQVTIQFYTHLASYFNKIKYKCKHSLDSCGRSTHIFLNSQILKLLLQSTECSRCVKVTQKNPDFWLCLVCCLFVVCFFQAICQQNTIAVFHSSLRSAEAYIALTGHVISCYRDGVCDSVWFMENHNWLVSWFLQYGL